MEPMKYSSGFHREIHTLERRLAEAGFLWDRHEPMEILAAPGATVTFPLSAAIRKLLPDMRSWYGESSRGRLSSFLEQTQQEAARLAQSKDSEELACSDALTMLAERAQLEKRCLPEEAALIRRRFCIGAMPVVPEVFVVDGRDFAAMLPRNGTSITQTYEEVERDYTALWKLCLAIDGGRLNLRARMESVASDRLMQLAVQTHRRATEPLPGDVNLVDEHNQILTAMAEEKSGGPASSGCSAWWR